MYFVHFGSRSLFAVDLLINNSTSSVCFALLLVKSHESRAQTDLNQFSGVRFLITRLMVIVYVLVIVLALSHLIKNPYYYYLPYLSIILLEVSSKEINCA